MVINLCANFGKPIQSKKKLWAGHISADRQMDRQSDSYLLPELRSGGIITKCGIVQFLLDEYLVES